jgi:hypothetical protein
MSSQSFANLANSEFNGNIVLNNGYIKFPDDSIQTTAGGGGNVSTDQPNTFEVGFTQTFDGDVIVDNNNTNFGQYGGNNNGFGEGIFFNINLSSATSNTVVGTNVCTNLTTGSLNCGFGSFSLAAITTGNENTCIGNNSGVNILTSSYNCSLGSNSLIDATGSNNTAIGYAAGENDVSGSNNTYLGYEAHQENSDTNQYAFLTLIGANSQPINQGSDNQIVVGRLNGDDELFIPGNNIFLGNQNNANETYTIEASGSNSTVIFTAQDSVPTGYQNILTLSTTSNSVPTLSYLSNGTSIINQTMLSTAFNNIIQVGQNITVVGTSPTTINFANPFPNGIIPVVTCQNSQGSTWVNIYLTIGTVTNTGFDVWEAGAGSPQQIAMNYIAIGLP